MQFQIKLFANNSDKIGRNLLAVSTFWPFYGFRVESKYEFSFPGLTDWHIFILSVVGQLPAEYVLWHALISKCIHVKRIPNTKLQA